MAKNTELRGLIYGRYDTEAQLAAELGWTKQKLNLFTNGMREPNLEDVVALANKLDKPVEDMIYIFLRHKSPNRQHMTA